MSGNPWMLLLVEDDKAVARMLTLALRPAGFDVVHAATGAEGLRLLNERHFDAAVLDLGLPDRMAGEVLQCFQCEKHNASGKFPWLVISAMDVQDATRRYAFPKDRFLAKPLEPRQLTETLRRLIAESSGPQRPPTAGRP